MKDIFEAHDFRIEVNEDMLMANEASLAFYRSKLRKDIQTLINGR
jgi:hypothetical protein